MQINSFTVAGAALAFTIFPVSLTVEQLSQGKHLNRMCISKRLERTTFNRSSET